MRCDVVNGNECEVREITAGDYRTPLDAILLQGGQPIDGSGLSVRFYMRATYDAAAGEPEPDPIVDQAAEWFDQAAGHARYIFKPNELVEGEYNYWFVVADGTTTDLFPHDGEKRKLVVHPRPKGL